MRIHALAIVSLAGCAELPSAVGEAPSEPVAARAASAPVEVEGAGPSLPVPPDPLAGFRVRGQPIHPDAVAALTLRGRAVDVVDLSPFLDAEPPTVDGASVVADHGDAGWNHYEVVGSSARGHLLWVVWSGGGTGRFSSVQLVRLRGESLTLEQHVPAGDRCNGGVAETPRFDGDEIQISRWLTPYDLIDLATTPPVGVEPYRELESSAASCVAFVTTRVDSDGDEARVGVTLMPEPLEDSPGWTDRFSRQSTFNAVFNRWLERGDVELDQAAIDRFAAEFDSL